MAKIRGDTQILPGTVTQIELDPSVSLGHVIVDKNSIEYPAQPELKFTGESVEVLDGPGYTTVNVGLDSYVSKYPANNSRNNICPYDDYIALSITPFDDPQNSNLLEIQNAAEDPIYTFSLSGVVFNEDASDSRDFRAESETEPEMIYLDAAMNAVYLGGTTNGVKIEKGGEISLLGDATVWNDSMIPATSFRTGGTGLTFAQFIGNIWMHRFDIGDIFYVQIQLPHGLKENTIIYPHLHLAVNSAIGATSYNVEVTTEQSWVNVGYPFPSPTVVSSGLLHSFQNMPQYQHDIMSLSSITPTTNQGGISSYVIYKVERVTPSVQALNPATSLFVLGMDIHYECDTIGSKIATAK